MKLADWKDLHPVAVRKDTTRRQTGRSLIELRIMILAATARFVLATTKRLVNLQLMTKPKQFSVLLVLVTVLCLFWLLILSASVKGMYLIELLDSTVGKLIIVGAILLPCLGIRVIKEKGATKSDRITSTAACLISSIPLVCIVFTFVSAQFGPLPGHIYETDLSKIAVGMSRDQVTQAIGTANHWSSDEHRERLVYYLQPRWWGTSRREFYVSLVDGKVINSKAMHLGPEEMDGFFAPPGLSNLFESVARNQTYESSSPGRN